MSKLIIVCGIPGVGKTTVAKELSKKLNISCYYKDCIKENLYDIMEGKNLDDSKRIGLYSIKLMFKLIEEQIKENIDLIIEGPFYINDDAKLLNNWKEKYNLETYTIICEIDDETRIHRYKNRDRHHSHYDEERIKLKENGEEKWWVFDANPNYENMPDKKIRIKTDKPVELLIQEILKKIN